MKNLGLILMVIFLIGGCATSPNEPTGSWIDINNKVTGTKL